MNSTMRVTIEIGDYESIEDEEQSVFIAEYKRSAEMTHTTSVDILENDAFQLVDFIKDGGVQALCDILSDHNRKLKYGIKEDVEGNPV